MSRITYADKQMQAYYLFNPDYQGLGIEEITKEMSTSPAAVEWLLSRLERDHPDLFIDIISDGRRFDHGVSRFGGWCEGDTVKKF